MSHRTLTIATLASAVLVAGCSDRTPVNPPLGGAAAITTAPKRPEALARMFAKALKNPAFRAYLKAQLDASPYGEHKLQFETFLGASGGRATTIGYRERADLRRAIDLLAARGFGEVGVFGFSLGGAVALLAAAEDPRIRAVAAYAPFADLKALGYELYGWLWVLKYPFVGLLRGWSRLFLGHDITTDSPERAAAKLTIPVLLVASREDEQIPFEHAERLRRALAPNAHAQFVTMDRGRHGELPAGFEARLAQFFLLYVR